MSILISFHEKSSQILTKFFYHSKNNLLQGQLNNFFQKLFASIVLFFFFHFSLHRNNDIYILNIFHGRIWSTDDQQWRRSAGIPPLVNAASRRQLEVSSSGWNRFQTRKFFREAPLIELFNGKTGINDWFHSWRGRTRCAKKKKKKWTVRNN